MSVEDFLAKVNDEVSSIISEQYEIEIIKTKYVPNFDDSYLTFDNLLDGKKKCKLIDTCVLYVDIRKSVNMNNSHSTDKLARIYSAFLRSVIGAARYFGGHIRNIIGDRLMVVFDTEKCFLNAYKTAALINSVTNYLMKERLDGISFRCGIGIDAGEMLVMKGGVVRRNGESEFYRGLVWLGRPANIASRLTDLANKDNFSETRIVHQGNYYKYLKEWLWLEYSLEYFLNQLNVTHSQILKHKDENFCSFFISSKFKSYTHSPILITEEVLKGLEVDQPDNEAIKGGWFRPTSIKISEYAGKIFGGSVYYSAVENL